MKHTLTFHSTIDCNIETLFAFHADTKNLPLITPPDISVEILMLKTPLQEGDEVRLRIRKGGIGFVWHLVFEKVEPPRLIVDKALRSPFAFFRHEHRFIAIDETHTILEDVITFSLPFEPLTTPIAWFIKRDMKKMFDYRHKETQKALALF